MTGKMAGMSQRDSRDGQAEAGGSVERVRQALLAAGHPDTIRGFPEGTRSAA